jgi:hypothetical protein
MVDALGYEILSRHTFCNALAPTRKRLNSVFGYSSTCVPSILSGRWPDEHYNWSYFIYDPQKSPFRNLRWLRWLPRAITSRRIFRRRLSLLVQKFMAFDGYFDLYNMPFEFLHLFDFSERKSPLKPGGMNRGTNIFDKLQEKQIPYFVSDPHQPEQTNFVKLNQQIANKTIDFAFMYWAGLDGLLHRVGNQSKELQPQLTQYEQWITQLMQTAHQHYDEVKLYIFSDHGMANCTRLVDLKASIEKLPFKFGQDYVVVYDSTMARFWFPNPAAKAPILKVLEQNPEGRILAQTELSQLRTFFADSKFGETIYLLKEGSLIVPSHMGERPITAMHGYHPTDPQSFASLMTNQPQIPATITDIPHIYNLMSDNLPA